MALSHAAITTITLFLCKFASINWIYQLNSWGMPKQHVDPHRCRFCQFCC